MDDEVTRREFVEATTLAVALSGLDLAAAPAEPTAGYKLYINGTQRTFNTDPRVTLLDLLREQLHLTGTKKGCDHGQCGACTVLVNDRRINACLTLAISLDGDQITTIEGLANGEQLHPLQTAFIENDAFQCGFCTSGQICSAVAILQEFSKGAPSLVTAKLPAGIDAQPELSDEEIRERMAGNICRCGAYPNIVAAIRAAHRAETPV